MKIYNARDYAQQPAVAGHPRAAVCQFIQLDTAIFDISLPVFEGMTTPGEIGCDECFDRLDEFAEMKLAGKTPEKAMPLVAEHLQKCGECRREFEALLKALRELQT